MKKTLLIFFTVIVFILIAAFDKKASKDISATYIPPSEQRTGDSAKGYQYLTTGDFIKSGIPYDFFIKFSQNSDNYLHREGKNATVDYGYNVVKNDDSMDIVVPTCLHCHAGMFEGKLVMGLGNSFADFTDVGSKNAKLSFLKSWKATAPRKYNAVRAFLQSLLVVDPLMETEVRGVNSADRLAALLVAHRDPKTLEWSEKPLLDIPPTVVPTDVPAWWLLKKKNAMFYNGFGRGDFSKFLMLSNILTVSDSSEAREVSTHFGDVLAYIRSLQPPPYPKEINKELAAEGQKVFAKTCEGCHGSYGPSGSYPNLLVAGSTIRTDSLLFKSNQQAKPFIDWFNNSWFAQAPYPARLEPQDGYVAPPLDGIWITAPYLHNGSVPTIEAVLNSKLRPKYWSRDFENPEYDYEHLGWKYEKKNGADGKKVYNTTLPGYGNYGHTFGDKLTNAERKAVIEYLKTL